MGLSLDLLGPSAFAELFKDSHRTERQQESNLTSHIGTGSRGLTTNLTKTRVGKQLICIAHAHFHPCDSTKSRFHHFYPPVEPTGIPHMVTNVVLARCRPH